jgi:hypothetical protein
MSATSANFGWVQILRLGLVQALDQGIVIPGGVVVDMHGVAVELAKRRQAAHRILIVIEYDDAHALSYP